MNRMNGMDIQQIRALSRRLRDEARDIETTLDRVSARLESVDWRGRDRDRFIQEWRNAHAGPLREVAAGLKAASRDAAIYADRQEAASRA